MKTQSKANTKVSMTRELATDLIPTGNFTSKVALAKQLNISTQTIRNYLLLTVLIPDFNADYPVVDGAPYTRMAMTEYQCWVISQIYQIAQSTPRPVLIGIIKENSAKLSKVTYNNLGE